MAQGSCAACASARLASARRRASVSVMVDSPIAAGSGRQAARPLAAVSGSMPAARSAASRRSRSSGSGLSALTLRLPSAPRSSAPATRRSACTARRWAVRAVTCRPRHRARPAQVGGRGVRWHVRRACGAAHAAGAGLRAIAGETYWKTFAGYGLAVATRPHSRAARQGADRRPQVARAAATSAPTSRRTWRGSFASSRRRKIPALRLAGVMQLGCEAQVIRQGVGDSKRFRELLDAGHNVASMILQGDRLVGRVRRFLVLGNRPIARRCVVGAG